MRAKDFLFRIAHWETWKYTTKYIPITPVWLWYCLRSRSFWFFTPSNPSLTFGGFEGESKKEMYEQLPPGSYPKTRYIGHNTPFLSVKAVAESEFSYPMAVKPDVGMMGFMFRKIESADDLRRYHDCMPVDYIIQEHIKYPIEVSVFYYRYPGQMKGTISGFIKKEALQLTGDGRSALRQLIETYPRLRFRQEEMMSKHKDKLDNIIPEGELFPLSYALNLSRGGKMISLKHENDEKLVKVFDAISQYSKHFYYGRYDIKCASIDDLKEGINFSILEYNGSGAEPHHVYGDGNNLLQAYKVFIHHWKVLFEISKLNHKNGIDYWGFRKGWKFLKEAKKHFRMLKQLDTEFPTS
ncbi:MAG: hypothetical protein ABI687_13545 [Flavitalea sp.]